MTIDNVQDTVFEFVKRLQLPESKYSFSINSNSDMVELIISVEGKMKSSLSIGNGTLKVLYDDNYGALDYVSQNFLTPISLLYYLCIFFFSAVSDISDMTFNDVLTVVLINDVYDWKTLIQGLSDNLGLSFRKIENYVTVNDVPISYNGFVNHIKIDKTEIKLEKSDYCSVVEAIFKSVEYVANLMDSADNLFTAVEEENNLLEEEEEENEEAPVDSGSDIDMDIDVDMMGESESSPEPVEPMENETFEEPQGPVVTPEDVL